ncbi:hypothetical protein [Sinosporangium siamense]
MEQAVLREVAEETGLSAAFALNLVAADPPTGNPFSRLT